jgi:hypothetical protein
VTVPPELWTRVIVVQWAELLAAPVGNHDWVITNMKTCGEALSPFHPDGDGFVTVW